MKRIITIFAISLIYFNIQAQTEAQLLLAAQSFPVMPKNTGTLIPFVQGQATFSSGTPFNDLEFTLFDTDYMDGENSGADVFMPVDPSDAFPGENKVKLVRCISNTDLDLNYQSGKTDRIILGTAEHPNPFFLKGADNIDNDYAVILHLDYSTSYIQLKGQALDYALRYYDATTNGVLTTGWYLFYVKNGALDLVSFIYPCNYIELSVAGNPPVNPNPICNSDNQLSLTNTNQFKFATPINTAAVITTGGIIQYGSNGKEVVGGSAKDSDGNIYLLGLTDGNLDGQTDASNEIFVSKISPTGQVLWVYELPMREGSFVKDAVVDNTHVYVAGRTMGNLPGFTNAGKWDGIILKLNKTTGILEASNQWGNEGIDGYGCIAQDDNGNIFVSAQGSEPGNSSFDNKYLVAKHNKSDLSNVWRMLDATTQTGFSNAAEAWGGITYVPNTTPGNGKLVVAGWVLANNGANAFTSVYENLNSTIPTRPYSNIIASSGSRAEWVLDNAVDSAGNFYYVGFTSGNLQGSHQGEGDAYIVKYNSSMQNPVFKQFGTPKGDLARKIEIDSDGTIYVVGYTYGNYAGNNADSTLLTGDVFIQKFDSNLNFLNNKQFGTPYEDRGMCHLIGNDLIITGMTEGTMINASNGSFDGFIASVNKNTLNFTTLGTENFELNNFSVYPNPVQDMLHINFENSIDSTIEIFNLQGQKILSKNTSEPNNEISISHLSDGIYLLKVGNSIRKIIKN